MKEGELILVCGEGRGLGKGMEGIIEKIERLMGERVVRVS